MVNLTFLLIFFFIPFASLPRSQTSTCFTLFVIWKIPAIVRNTPIRKCMIEYNTKIAWNFSLVLSNNIYIYIYVYPYTSYRLYFFIFHAQKMKQHPFSNMVSEQDLFPNVGLPSVGPMLSMLFHPLMLFHAPDVQPWACEGCVKYVVSPTYFYAPDVQSWACEGCVRVPHWLSVWVKSLFIWSWASLNS